MKSLIICSSTHHGSTRKIADVMGNVLEARVKEPKDVDIAKLKDYDLIGFGSGIYVGKHHKTIFGLVDRMPSSMNKRCFIFSTSGSGRKDIQKNHRKLREKLIERGFRVVEEFSCRGFSSFGPLKLIGGMNKDRPDEYDLKRAEKFAEGLKEK